MLKTERASNAPHPGHLPEDGAEQRRQNSREFCYQVVQLGVALALAVFCINAGYNFEGTATRLGDYLFVSRPLTGASEARLVSSGNRFAKSWLRGMPVPLPRNYVEGIDLQWHDIEAGKPSYLRGCWRKRGWWYWYLYALIVKVPLGTWGLLLLAIGVRTADRWRLMRRKKIDDKTTRLHPEGDGVHHAECDDYGSRITWRDEFVVLAPAVVVLALVSSQTGFSRYIRYVLPIFPFVFIWISSVAQSIEQKQKKLILPVMVLLAWSIASSLWCAPHWMSYFNELAGGPFGGPKHLLDAQVDWGQDLLYLKKWLDAHPDARPLKLVYFGPIDPRVAGIEFSVPPTSAHAPRDPSGIGELPASLQPGWYAVSVNFLYGYPHYALDGRGGRAHFERAAYNYFRRFRPVATAGYSIYIYEVTNDDLVPKSRRGDGTEAVNDPGKGRVLSSPSGILNRRLPAQRGANPPGPRWLRCQIQASVPTGVWQRMAGKDEGQPANLASGPSRVSETMPAGQTSERGQASVPTAVARNGKK